MILFQLIAGLIILLAGAELLVKGATKVASAAGISPLVIGLTVVAFGTSAPELSVSVMSAMKGNPDIALGNVIGSNIFNILVVLGLASLLISLRVQQQLIRLDVPVLIVASLLILLFGVDGKIARWEGHLLVLMGITYTIFVIRLSRKELSATVIDEYQGKYGSRKTPWKGSLWISALLVLAGLAMLVFGSRWLVESAVQIASVLGVSDLVIGITIIAAGTSLPEVATSVIAAVRGERDIAVGNAVGSSIFNLVFILGITATVGGDLHVPEAAQRFDLPVMIAVAVACLPIFFTGKKLDRWEGFVFLFYYVAYTTYLVLMNQKASTLDIFTKAMAWFTIPITVLTLIVVTIREYQKRNDTAESKAKDKRPKW